MEKQRYKWHLTSYQKRSVLVHLFDYNNTPQTGWLQSNDHLFITVLKAGSVRTGFQHGGVRPLFWVADFSLYGHMLEGVKKLSGEHFLLKKTKTKTKT